MCRATLLLRSSTTAMRAAPVVLAPACSTIYCTTPGACRSFSCRTSYTTLSTCPTAEVQWRQWAVFNCVIARTGIGTFACCCAMRLQMLQHCYVSLPLDPNVLVVCVPAVVRAVFREHLRSFGLLWTCVVQADAICSSAMLAGRCTPHNWTCVVQADGICSSAMLAGRCTPHDWHIWDELVLFLCSCPICLPANFAVLAGTCYALLHHLLGVLECLSVAWY
jgi:hypothetical protein